MLDIKLYRYNNEDGLFYLFLFHFLFFYEKKKRKNGLKKKYM